MRNPLWAWQDLNPDSGYGTFNAFCDALEVKNGVSASSKGWGLQHALQAWGSWWNQTYYPEGKWNPNVCRHHTDHQPAISLWRRRSSVRIPPTVNEDGSQTEINMQLFAP